MRHRDPGDENDYWERLPVSAFTPPGMRIEVARPFRLRLERGLLPPPLPNVDDLPSLIQERGSAPHRIWTG